MIVTTHIVQTIPTDKLIKNARKYFLSYSIQKYVYTFVHNGFIKLKNCQQNKKLTMTKLKENNNNKNIKRKLAVKISFFLIYNFIFYILIIITTRHKWADNIKFVHMITQHEKKII